MIVLLLIGLFTYRIVLRSLGVTDIGVYGAVSGVITGFMLVMNTVVAAISRFIFVGLGEGNRERLKTIFGTSLLIMAAFCVLLAVFTETVGVWHLHHNLKIPPGRMDAAELVLQTSLLVVVLNLLSTPYSAVINAHEHMGAYAWISLIEGFLKLGVAFCLWFTSADKLQVYAWLLVAVAFLSRAPYVLYAMLRFPESRGLPRFDGALVREMGVFAGWNFVSSGAYMLNTQGINQLMNLFFGVGMNAARNVADKVEQVVRQFATNIALALNPALTKAYVGGNKEYAYELVCKGSKYYFWVLWVLAIPFITDAEPILALWLGEAPPPEAAHFTSLTVLCFLVDFTPATLNVLEQANGRIKRYSILTSLVAVMAFPITYVAYKLGAPAWAGYVIFIVVYLLKSVVMVRVAHQDTGLPIGDYWKKGIWPALVPSLFTLMVATSVSGFIPPVWWRFLVVVVLELVSMGVCIWAYGLTPGEKAFVKEKIFDRLKK